MNNLPEEIKQLIDNEYNLSTLFKLTQTSKENLITYQQLIFMKHEVNYNKEIKYYDTTQITKIKNINKLTNEEIKNLNNLTT